MLRKRLFIAKNGLYLSNFATTCIKNNFFEIAPALPKKCHIHISVMCEIEKLFCLKLEAVSETAQQARSRYVAVT